MDSYDAHTSDSIANSLISNCRLETMRAAGIPSSRHRRGQSSFTKTPGQPGDSRTCL
ncbi:unnamed protein product [Penicillium roqueforti FM164]|uniref:Genomic scaffold, ProqFM164S01 n=1 Tax=Penicillium roqueforti (strain FM164) TaxID=1365484 RepID=W6Q2X9_PENRF|nr:unnamed protein product [Penicillium roqueforti FM164]